MPAGKSLIEIVAAALDPETGMTTSQILFHIPEPKPSARAVRYAVKELVAQGRARRPFSTGDLVSQGPVFGVKKPEAAEPQAAE